MTKRDFLKASAAGVVGAAPLSAAPGTEASAREIFELRTWQLKSAKQPLLDAYLSKAFLPALGRAGCGPTGIFAETGAGEELRISALIVHPGIEHAGSVHAKLKADAAYQSDAKEYLAATAADPVYSRMECSLHRAIAGMPKLARTDPKQPRIFNLRIYESHNERAAAKKIEMFNEGELAIFQRVGLTPVFFGETIAGINMPNLTYLLVFSGEDARKAAWDKFRGDAEWLKLKAIPEYADKEIVLRITNKLLTPTAYSQL